MNAPICINGYHFIAEGETVCACKLGRAAQADPPPQPVTERTDRYIDTYTPILWALLTDEEKYVEYIKARRAAAPAEGAPGEGYEHWRKMATDTMHLFWFTNREAGVLLAEIDRLRGVIAHLRG